MVESVSSGGVCGDKDLPGLVQFDSSSPRVDMFHDLMGDTSRAPFMVDGVQL